MFSTIGLVQHSCPAWTPPCGGEGNGGGGGRGSRGGGIDEGGGGAGVGGAGDGGGVGGIALLQGVWVLMNLLSSLLREQYSPPAT